MLAIKTVALFIAAASAVVLPRDVSTVMANLQTIDKDTNSLTSSVNSWDGSFFGALPIASSENTLDSDVKSATTEAKTESQFDSADSQTIVSYLTGTLGPDANTALQALEAKKSEAESAGISGTVDSGLKTLQTDIAALGAALVAIMSSDQQSACSSAVSTINGYFTTAINDYSS